MIQLSRSAIAEVTRIKSKYPNPDAVVRLSVKPGGCADFYYTLAIDEAIASGDQVVQCGGIWVAVDAESWPYVNGLSLDYSEDLMGGGFRFQNPQAVSHCGCGNSFTVTEA